MRAKLLGLGLWCVAACDAQAPSSAPTQEPRLTSRADELVLKDVPLCATADLTPSLTQVCSISDVGDLEFVNALPFGTPELPTVHVGRIYGVRMTPVTGQNQGEFSLVAAREGDYMVYLGTPNVPFEVTPSAPSCGAYLSPTLLTQTGNGDCANRRFLGVYKVHLQADTPVSVRLGPISPQSWVRVFVAPIEGALRATAVSAGYAHTCARTEGGSLKCWGANDTGALGIGSTLSRGYSAAHMGDALPAIRLGTGVSAAHVRASVDRSCAILTDGRVKCWGFNGVGGLGTEDTLNRGDTVDTTGGGLPVTDLGTATFAEALFGGDHHECARLSTGQLKCWGLNAYGQLGLPHRNQRGSIPRTMGNRLTPLAFPAGRSVVSADGSAHHACAVLDDGSLYCWGCSPFGQLGRGYTDTCPPSVLGVENAPPVDLGPGRLAAQVATGGEHTCALTRAGEVLCWGYNEHGQLGQGDTSLRGDDVSDMGSALVPVDLGGSGVAVAIDAGEHHTCVLLEEGVVKCWGYNTHGELGVGDGRDRGVAPGELGEALPAVDLGTGRHAVQLSAGFHHTCALLDDGAIKCWGANQRGQLGLGERTSVRRGDQPNEMGDHLPAVYLGARELGL